MKLNQFIKEALVDKKNTGIALLNSIIISAVIMFFFVDYSIFQPQQKTGIVVFYIILLLMAGLHIGGDKVIRKELGWVLKSGGFLLGALMVIVTLVTLIQPDKTIFFKLLFIIGLPGIALIKGGLKRKNISTEPKVNE